MQGTPPGASSTGTPSATAAGAMVFTSKTCIVGHTAACAIQLAPPMLVAIIWTTWWCNALHLFAGHWQLLHLRLWQRSPGKWRQLVATLAAEAAAALVKRQL